MRLTAVLRRLAVMGTVLLSSASLFVGYAEAAPLAITIDCAQAIGVEIDAPGSYILQRGVRDCPSDIAIQVSASDVSVNLNGRIIDAEDNDVLGTIGIAAVTGASNVKIRNGTVSDFFTGVQVLGTAGVIKQITTQSSSNGIVVLNDSTITGCTILGSATNGISGGDGNTISNNVVRGSSEGIDVLNGNTITGNISESARLGIVTGSDNTIIGNTTNSNAEIGVAGGDRNVVKRNTANGNGEHGIALDADNTLRANRTSRNLVDGILIGQPGAGTALRDNVANRNGNFGIEAGPGVAGAGTNSASGNGNPVSQCDPADLCV